jgi:hypothetical protein
MKPEAGKRETGCVQRASVDGHIKCGIQTAVNRARIDGHSG